MYTPLTVTLYERHLGVLPARQYEWGKTYATAVPISVPLLGGHRPRHARRTTAASTPPAALAVRGSRRIQSAATGG